MCAALFEIVNRKTKPPALRAGGKFSTEKETRSDANHIARDRSRRIQNAPLAHPADAGEQMRSASWKHSGGG
jgi:hypothetical protein